MHPPVAPKKATNGLLEFMVGASMAAAAKTSSLEISVAVKAWATESIESRNVASMMRVNAGLDGDF